MNAKQIADELENIYWIQGDGKGKPFQQYADFVRQQQAEIEALKKHNEELQKACVETLVWVMGNGGYCSLDIEVILKNVLGSEWEDYK